MNATVRGNESPLRLRFDVAIPFVGFLAIIGLTSLAINALIVVIICKHWKKRKGYDLFTLQNTLIDLVTTVITIPFWILTAIYDDKFENEIVCRLNASICLMEILLPVMFLMLASAYRHSGLVGHEAHERVFTGPRSVFFILLVWLLSILLCLPQNVGWKLTPEVNCIPDLMTNIWFTMYMLTFFFILPLVAAVYAHIYDTVLFIPERFKEKSSALFQICKKKALRGEELEIQKSLFTVLMTHTCCWLPYILVSIAENLAGSHAFFVSGVSFHFITLIVGLSSMSIKGALFSFENPRIRHQVKELFGYEENGDANSHRVTV